MMKHLLIVIIAMSAIAPSFGADWSNFLKGVQKGCDFNLDEHSLNQKLQKKSGIPQALQKDITKYTAKTGADAYKSVDVQLKNATAFGKPITRIVLDNSEWGYSAIHLYFTDGNFTKIKSSFTTKVEGKTYAVGTKKAWVFVGEDEDIQATSVPYKGNKPNNYASYDATNRGGAIVVHENGWWHDSMSYGNYGMITELSFDSKAKRISCESAFG